MVKIEEAKMYRGFDQVETKIEIDNRKRFEERINQSVRHILRLKMKK